MKTALLLSATAVAPVSASLARSKFTQHSRRSCHGSPLKIGNNGHSYDDAKSVEDCHSKCASSEECVAFDVTTAAETFELTGNQVSLSSDKKMEIPEKRCYYKGSNVVGMSLAENRDCHVQKESAGEISLTGQQMEVKWEPHGVHQGFSCEGQAAHVGAGGKSFDDNVSIADCQHNCGSHAYACAGFSVSETGLNSNRCYYHAKVDKKKADKGAACHSWTRLMDPSGLALIQSEKKQAAAFVASTDPLMAGDASANIVGLLPEIGNGIEKLLEWKTADEIETFMTAMAADVKAAVDAVNA